MLKRFFLILVALFLLSAAGPALAALNLQVAHLNTPGTDRTLILPPAADNSPVISLGTAVDPQSGKLVSGYAIVHPKKSPAKPSWAGGAGGTKCYGFFAKGAKWKSVEPWIVNPSNTSGLSTSFVLSNLGFDIDKWEDATDGVVGNIAGVNILGDGSSTSSIIVADTVTPDGNNEVYFADISSSSTIAVTIIWGIFGGPISGRELVEWDQVYDDVDFNWSGSGQAGKMDFENIATHELGHSVGLSDLYNSDCSEQTMYGYAGTGEIKKQTLESGDITGISTLY